MGTVGCDQPRVSMWQRGCLIPWSWFIAGVKLILAIDDDPDVLQLLEKQLVQFGHRVVTTESSQRGLEIAQTGNPDLIILDIRMPVIDGLEALRRLRGDPATSLTPVIIVAEKTEQARVTDAMKLGVDDYLLKPYTVEQLEEKLESAFSWNVFHQIHTDEDPTLRFDREQGRAVIAFLENLTAPATREAVAALVTPDFMRAIESDHCVLDLRLVSGMTSNELPALREVLSLLSPLEVHIVAGRNFGLLLEPVLEMGDRVQLYLSFGDFALALRARRPQ